MWTRNDTKDWLFQIEHRLYDFDYYLKETLTWCEDHYIYDDKSVFGCCLMTLVWVSHMRGEKLSKNETFEILGITDYPFDNSIYELNENLQDLDHEDLLNNIVRNLPNY
jgi:hypothetical protein